MYWTEFWDCYEKQIHNTDMPNWIKFKYLKKRLVGKEFGYIQSMHNTDENYERAVTMLRAQYGNVANIKAARLQAISDLPILYLANNWRYLRYFIHSVESHLGEIESLDKEFDRSSLVDVILSKLNVKRLKQVKEMQQKDGLIVTFDYLMNMLKMELSQNKPHDKLVFSD